MKRNIKIIATVIMLCVLFLTGCMSDEAYQKGLKLEAQAREIIPDYLYKKYGFKADIVEVNGHIKRTGIWEIPSYTQIVTAICEHNGKTFHVRVNLEKETFGDDYQFDEIKRDFSEFIENYFSLDTYLVPESVKINCITGDMNPDNWQQGYWNEDEYYNGNMDSFIGNVSAMFVSKIQLFVGTSMDSKDSAMKQLMYETESLRKLMQNMIYVEFAFYNLEEVSPADVESKMKNYDEFLLELIAEVSITSNRKGQSKDGKSPEAFTKVYDYTQYFPVIEVEEVNGVEICGYTVNGETVSGADKFVFNEYEDIKKLRTDATLLTGRFYYYDGDMQTEDWYPEHRNIRFNLSQMFPSQVYENKNIVVIRLGFDRNVEGTYSGTVVRSLKEGEYLYFRCMGEEDYAIGIID